MISAAEFDSTIQKATVETTWSAITKNVIYEIVHQSVDGKDLKLTIMDASGSLITTRVPSNIRKALEGCRYTHIRPGNSKSGGWHFKVVKADQSTAVPRILCSAQD